MVCGKPRDRNAHDFRLIYHPHRANRTSFFRRGGLRLLRRRLPVRRPIPVRRRLRRLPVRGIPTPVPTLRSLSVRRREVPRRKVPRREIRRREILPREIRQGHGRAGQISSARILQQRVLQQWVLQQRVLQQRLQRESVRVLQTPRVVPVRLLELNRCTEDCDCYHAVPITIPHTHIVPGIGLSRYGYNHHVD